ncbi:WD40 repeat domain-containing protein [Streptomyces sp. NPDC004111]|uniref:WD40 repeat domain-containing protein n=1 Tax=Streptomyces sp. NPDC004111 TaxID=3364690 RepID=UPI0036BB70DC
MYLIHAEPDTLAPYLHHAGSETAQLHAAVYRTTVTHHPQRHDPAVRRDLLALDAAGWQQPALARTFTHVPLPGRPLPPTPSWASLDTHSARRHTLAAHSDDVTAVAVTDSPDGPLAITTGNSHTAIVWDVLTGQRRHTLTGHTNWVTAVAVTDSPKGPLAITTSHDRTAIVWNLTTGMEAARCHLRSQSVQLAWTRGGFVVTFGHDVAHFAFPAAGATSCPSTLPQ